VGLDLLPWPKVDFAKFGPVERKDLSRIKKISGANLHRNWVMIPTSPTTTRPTSPSWKPSACHQQGEREERRQGDHAGLRDQGLVAALKKFPEFNASLDGDTWSTSSTSTSALPPTRPTAWWCRCSDADKASCRSAPKWRAGQEGARRQAGRGRHAGRLLLHLSLGGIGGTHFTPIINAPEVAILGLSKAR
jgi:pyruvate dehydrogenase E2 component (dihydrolipoamide acetyltransferase)